MTKKIGDKKVGGVKSAKEAADVEGTEAVTGVGGVQATTGVGGVKGAGAVGKRRATRTMTMAEREQLFRMINEEADKMFNEQGIPAKQREVLANAVKMAVDVGIIPEDEEEPGKK